MRTTLDLPDNLLRELKSRAALNGKSLKSLLQELIVRGMRQPAPSTPEAQVEGPPILDRLKGQALNRQGALSNAETAELELQEDLDKSARIGSTR